MAKQTLYQISASTGKTKVWSIWVEDNGDSADIVIQSGQLGGKLITNRETISEGKNIGKANETNYWTQAQSELQSKVDQKLRKGYVYNLNEVKSSAILGSGIPAPLLAQKFHATGAQKGSKTLKQLKLEGEKIIVQDKLDGNRCITLVTCNDSRIESSMWTRKGDKMPVQLSHILNDISSTAASLKLKNGLKLDGELYVEPSIMSFNTLNGLLKNQTPNLIELSQRQQIKLFLYDVMVDKGYEERKEIIKPFESDNVIIVKSREIIATNENIQRELEDSLERGYEGLMIRVLGKGYEHKRSWQLMKCKVFQDEEFKLVGFEKDSRGNFVGAFIMELPKPVKGRDGKVITTFRAGASGQTEKERSYMWEHQNEFLNKKATIEFFGYSEYGIPRFGKYKALRDDV